MLLSAVVPEETLQDFAHWFGANRSDVITSEWRPSIQRYARLEWRGDNGILRYSRKEDIDLLQAFVPGVIRQRTFEYTNPETGRINRKRFPQPKQKAQTAAELAFKFSELGPVLVFCSQPAYVEAVAKALRSRLELMGLSNETIPARFHTGKTRSALVAIEWLGQDHLISQMLAHGVAVHHGNLPDAVREAVEADFRDKKYQLIAATNTLAQGVNLPLRTVIVHSCWRWTGETRERIPARDYWNIAGRAGRAREETEGTIIHIIANPSDLSDYRYYLEHKESVEPIDSGLYRLLEDLIEERITEAALQEVLDPEVLAILVEEGLTQVSVETMDSVLHETLVYRQAGNRGLPTAQLRDAFRQVGMAVLRTVPEGAYREIYNMTGLRTESCQAFRDHVLGHRDTVRRLLLEGETDDISDLSEIILDACLEIPEMQPEGDFAGNYLELLGLWLTGADMSELRAEFEDDAPSVEELGALIEDLFGYRLPWGISGYTRIACKVLDIDVRDVSTFTKFFPSMVKFGVPFPEAAWAMAAGIPLRRVAIEIASQYVEKTTSPKYRDFLEWLGSLDSELLQQVYGLTSPVLEDVTRALRRSVLNPLLADYSGLEPALSPPVEVRGIRYEHSRIRLAARARPGVEIKLVRDYDNPVDRNAVLVILHGETLGFLPADIAQVVAPEIDVGLELRGIITAVERGRVPAVRIQLSTRGEP